MPTTSSAARRTWSWPKSVLTTRGPASPFLTTVPRTMLVLPMKVATNSDARALVDLARLAELHHLALVEHRDPVRHRERLGLVVGNVDEGQAELAAELLQLGAQRLAHLAVEVRERLVEQQQLGVRDQRAGEGQALLLAAAELTDERWE